MCFGILSPSIPKQDPGYDVTSLIDIGCSQSQRQATGAIADLRFEKGILHSIFEDWFQLICCNACGPNQASKRSVHTSQGLFLILNLPGKVSIEVSHISIYQPFRQQGRSWHAPIQIERAWKYNQKWCIMLHSSSMD